MIRDHKVDRTDPFPVRRFGRYVLIDRLAVGGMAEVYVACVPSDPDRLLVVKRILPHLAHNPEFVESFAREAKLAAGIHHENVIRIVELGEADEVPFIVMEYLEGLTMKELLSAARAANVRVPLDVALHLIGQACEGAHAAHELLDDEGRPYGLVHRDITPHNLMVNELARVKLLDFGIAKAREGMDQTRTGVLKGKIAYMSPEQCRQEPLDRRSDVFSLAVVTYQLLAGEKPFQGSSELATMQAIILGKHRPLTEVRDDVPAAVAAAIDRAMHVDANRRPSTALSFGRSLVEAASHAGITADANAAQAWIRATLGSQLHAKRLAVDVARSRTLDSLSDPGASQARPPDPWTTGGLWSTGVSHPREFAPPARGGSGPRPAISARPTRALGTAIGLCAALGMLGASLQWVSGSPVQLGALAATGATGDGAGLSILIAPMGDAGTLLRELEPVRIHLESELGEPVSLQFAENYAQAASAIASGEVEIGVLPALAVARAQEIDRAVEIVAVAEVDRTRSNDAYILVRRDGPIQALADLRGKVMCWVDPLSSTGFDLPQRFLKGRKIDPDKLAPHMSGNHDQVLRDLLEGRCDAGATHSGNYLDAAQRGIPTARLRILAITGNAPHEAVVARPHAQQELVDAVREALYGFDPSRDGVFPNAEGRSITGFSPPPPDYPHATVAGE